MAHRPAAVGAPAAAVALVGPTDLLHVHEVSCCLTVIDTNLPEVVERRSSRGRNTPWFGYWDDATGGSRAVIRRGVGGIG